MKTSSHPPAPEARRRVISIPPEQIVYFHAVLEGYDDLAVMRTISPEEGLVEVYISPGAEGEFGGLLDAIREEGIALEETDDCVRERGV